MKDGQGFARRVTGENLGQFAPLLGRKSKSDSAESPDNQTPKEKASLDPELQAAEELFSGNPIKISIPARFSQPGVTKKRKRPSERKAQEESPTTPSISTSGRGPLIWEKKNLHRADAQQPKQGSPTGGLRLVQAEWRIDNKKIDQTTYFRNIIFGKLNWTVGVRKPKKQETTLITFVVRILDEDYGERKLVVSHKPSGEAGQRNYTTMLHWGDLGEKIKELNLVGKTFQLYGPPEGELEPFFIEII